MAGVTQMGSYTNFPQGFAYGVSVRGTPITQAQPGEVFFVGAQIITRYLESEKTSAVKFHWQVSGSGDRLPEKLRHELAARLDRVATYFIPDFFTEGEPRYLGPRGA